MLTLSSFDPLSDPCCLWCLCVSVCRRVCQQLSESMELCTRLQDLEKDLSTRLTSMEEGKQQLQEQYTDAQAKISSLAQVCVGGCACVCLCCVVLSIVTDSNHCCRTVVEAKLSVYLYLGSRNGLFKLRFVCRTWSHNNSSPLYSMMSTSALCKWMYLFCIIGHTSCTSIQSVHTEKATEVCIQRKSLVWKTQFLDFHHSLSHKGGGGKTLQHPQEPKMIMPC